MLDSVERYLILLSSILSVVVGCGPKQMRPSSILDTPENHYRNGMRKFEDSDLRSAQSEFDRARALNPDFSGSFVGSALVAAKQGNFFLAKKQLEQAIHKDNGFSDSFVAKGRIITMEGVSRGNEIDSWLEDAQRAFRKASRLAPEDDYADYHTGMSYLQAFKFDSALASFNKIMNRNKSPYMARALKQTERIQTIKRASPGSDHGMKISMNPEITRAELAVLLIEELKLAELVRQHGPGNTREIFLTPKEYNSQSKMVISDIQSSWAKPWIEELLSLGIPGLELMPDGHFRPDEVITRAIYARTNAAIVTLISHDPDLVTQYIGESPRFPDVRGDSFAYNAIALSIDRGIMTVDPISGRFRPDDNVSGAEALLIIRRLQNAVRMEF